MKRYFICWVALMLLAGCHEDENELLDSNGFPKVSEHNLDASAGIKEFFSHQGGEDAFQNSDCQQWKGDHYRTAFTCFHSPEEVKASRYAAGIENLPPVEWQTQTLVICSVYSRTAICDGCFAFHVYSHSGKYTIDVTLYEGDYNLQMSDDIGVAILLSRKGVKREDLKLVLDTQRIKME